MRIDNSTVTIEQVVPGNGNWIIDMGDRAYQVMHFIYWYGVDVSGEMKVRRRFMTVETFGAKDDMFEGEIALLPFEGHVFPSKADARWWAKANCHNGEFNEGEL